MAATPHTNVGTVMVLPKLAKVIPKPLLILTSSYSASGSELFSAAARDHGFGVALGQRTYGKGIAQSRQPPISAAILPAMDNCAAAQQFRFYFTAGCVG